MKVDPSLVHRLFYPQVPLVMAAQSNGRVSAMPVVSYASISDRPSLVAVACNPMSFTCKLARKAGSFSLSVLDRRHAGAIARLASASGADAKDKLADAGLKHVGGRALKVPSIAAALATLECSLRFQRKFGDHQLLIGRVEAAYSTSAFRESWDYGRYNPLLYTGWKDKLTTYQGSYS